MSDSVKRIVDSYVSLKNREALERLREHRQRLKTDIQERPKEDFDTSHLMRYLDEDLEVIESGLARL